MNEKNESRMTRRKYLPLVTALLLLVLFFTAGAPVPPCKAAATSRYVFCQYVDPTVSFEIEAPEAAAAWIRVEWCFEYPVPYRWLMPAEALKSKKGVCIDFANLLCSDLRSYGLQAWVVVGNVPVGDIYILPGLHAWVECQGGTQTFYMDWTRNYGAVPTGWQELYRYNEARAFDKIEGESLPEPLPRHKGNYYRWRAIP